MTSPERSSEHCDPANLPNALEGESCVPTPSLDNRPGAVIIISNDERTKFLMQRKDDTHPLESCRGKLSFFGGSIDQEEISGPALLRELVEEIPAALPFLSGNLIPWKCFEDLGGAQFGGVYNLDTYFSLLPNEQFEKLVNALSESNQVLEGELAVLDIKDIREALGGQDDTFIASLHYVLQEYLDQNVRELMLRVPEHSVTGALYSSPMAEFLASHYLSQEIAKGVRGLIEKQVPVGTAAAGAGSGIGNEIWRQPGVSASLCASDYPYKRSQIDSYLGGISLPQYVGPDAASALSGSAYLKAQQALFAENEASRIPDLVAAGAAAAVQTSRTRRGKDQVFLALRDFSGVKIAHVEFAKETLTRVEQGKLVDVLMLNTLLEGAGLEQISVPNDNTIVGGDLKKSGDFATLVFSAPHMDYSIEDDQTVLFDQTGNRMEDLQDLQGKIIVPGSFNPLTFAHDNMAQYIRDIEDKEVVFEITVANADKGEINIPELQRRAQQFHGRWPVVVSPHATFLDKARNYPQVDFCVGVDTALRIVDPKYYPDGDVEKVVQEFKDRGVRFYAISRKQEDGSDYDTRVLNQYSDVFEVVKCPRHLIDVSSTKMRPQ